MVDTSYRRRVSSTKPPSLPSIVSVVTIVCSCALAVDQSLLSPALLSHVVGWLCGAVVPIVALVWHRLRVRALRARPDFSSTRFSGRLVAFLVVVGLGVGAYHAWFVALWRAS